MNQSKKDPNQNQDQNQLSEREKLLEEQLAHYRTLLEQRQNETEEAKQEKAAEALKAEEAALLEQTNLRAVLKDAFPGRATAPVDEVLSQESPQLNQKEMLDVMGEVVGNAIEANTKLILNKVGALIKGSDEKLAGTQKALIGLMSHMSVTETKNNHKDYDVYKEDIADIMSKTNGLSVEQAYVLAKAQKQEKVPGREKIESERPDRYASRSHDYDERDYNEHHEEKQERRDDLPRNPRNEFRKGVSDAIDRVLDARG